MSGRRTTHISDAEWRTTAIDNKRGYEAAVKRFEKRLGVGDIDGALAVVNSPNFREAEDEAAWQLVHKAMDEAKAKKVEHLRFLTVVGFHQAIRSAQRLRHVEHIAATRSKLLAARVAELEARLAAIEGSKSKKRTGKTT